MTVVANAGLLSNENIISPAEKNMNLLSEPE